jgi:hypothetical protein
VVKVVGHLGQAPRVRVFRARSSEKFPRLPPSLMLWRALQSIWPRRSLGEVGTQAPYNFSLVLWRSLFSLRSKMWETGTSTLRAIYYLL